MDGFLIIDKPAGPSSAAVVARLKRLLPKVEGKRPKIGHGGTLDPLATGLLPIGIGKATKRLQALLEGLKIYEFSIVWGIQTSTDDAEGEIVAESAVRPTAAQVEAILGRFTGVISQMPPAFSALKVGGERAYKLARQGAVVALEPRPVTVYSLKLLQNDAKSATFTAEVGKGTYVRSLARDMALALGTAGHVGSLQRTGHGPFTLQDAVTLDKFTQTTDIAQYLLPLDANLAGRFTDVSVQESMKT